MCSQSTEKLKKAIKNITINNSDGNVNGPPLFNLFPNQTRAHIDARIYQGMHGNTILQNDGAPL